MKVADPFAETLEIQGIDRFWVADYMANGLSVSARQEAKKRMIYKEPSGSNVSWSYSPIYRLGEPKRNSKKDLLGDKGRLQKLRDRVLNDYEKEAAFAPGTVDLLMKALSDQVDTLAALWSDQDSAYLLILGVSHQGHFLISRRNSSFCDLLPT